MNAAQKKIIAYLQKNHVIRLEDLSKELKVSKQYISRIIKPLIELGEVEKTGVTKGTYFTLQDTQGISLTVPTEHTYDVLRPLQNLKEDEILDEITTATSILKKIPQHVYRKFAYTFTEMLNNAIDHSHGNTVRILVIRNDDQKISSWIIDDGIGIFTHIQKKLNLPDDYAAIQELLKGKTTTDPKRHTGEGIFFTSRIADTFIIDSKDKRIVIKNNDQTVKEIQPYKGTRIKFVLHFNSSKTTENVFKEFTEDYEFNTTEIVVKLYEIKTEFVSRSEAKRLLHGLEKFKHIILDFHNVDSIGQGFADEIFRVWQQQYPYIQISYMNTSAPVKFMIKRSLSF